MVNLLMFKSFIRCSSFAVIWSEWAFPIYLELVFTTTWIASGYVTDKNPEVEVTVGVQMSCHFSKITLIAEILFFCPL